MTSQENRIRAWAASMAREVKWLFARVIVPRAWLWRWLFMGDDGEVSRIGEHVLADLRRYCFANPMQSTFHTDPLEMARRQGRREVFGRITYFLNLDEAKVQELMEIDDGNGW